MISLEEFADKFEKAAGRSALTEVEFQNLVDSCMEARNHEYPRLRYTEILSLVYSIGRRDGAEHNTNLPSYKTKQLEDYDNISSTTHPFSYKKE